MLEKVNDAEKEGEKFDPNTRIGGPFSFKEFWGQYQDLIIPRK